MVSFASTQQSLSDYGGYYRSRSRYFEYAPATAEELQAAVCEANARRMPIRIRGNGHSMNGTAIPRADELLLRVTGLDHYRFDAEGTLTVGAGAAVWDVHALLRNFGFDLPVYNDGDAAAPSVGGYLAAGGFGATSGRHGGFWETVAALTLVSGDGRRLTSRPGDELFPWLFGSMGQLGIICEATLRIIPLPGRPPAYPRGSCGHIAASRHDWEKNMWYTVFVPKPAWPQALGDLIAIGRRHAPAWRARPPYAYDLPFRTFNPPLIHPRQENLAAVGIWGEIPAGDFDPEGLRRLDAAIADWLRSHPDYRRYAQAELVFEEFDYRAQFGPIYHARLTGLKRVLDPLQLLVPGVLSAPANTRAASSEGESASRSR